MYNNVDVYPLDKLAMDNEGYHDPVDREYYLSPSGEDIPEKLKQESSFSKSQEDLKKGQNGTAVLRPKNSRFDSGKFSGSQIYYKFPFVNQSFCHCGHWPWIFALAGHSFSPKRSIHY